MAAPLAGLDHGGSRGDRSLQPGDHRRGFLFASGQILDPTGIITEGGITAQTHQVLQNLGAVLKAAGISYDRVVKTTVYPLGYGQLSRGERNLRHLLPRAGARAGYDSGRRASTQRAGRNRPGGVVAG